MSILIACHTSVSGQHLPLRLADSSDRTDLRIDHLSLTQSSAFSFDFLTASNWDDQIKRKQLDRVNSSVRLGFGNRTDLRYKLKETGTGHRLVHIMHTKFSSLNLDKALLELALFGNAQFKGSKIQFDASDYRTTEFSSVYLKKVQQHSGSYLNKRGFGLGVHFGHVYNSYNTTGGYVLTDSLIEFIETDASFANFRNNRNWLGGVGAGISLSLGHDGVKDRWLFETPDLGVLYWPSSRKIETRADLQRFEGFYIDDITRIEGNWQDSLDDEFLVKKDVNAWKLNAFSLQFSYGRTIGKKASMDFRMLYRNLPGFIPEMSLTSGSTLGKTVYTAGLSFGGWSGLRTDLHALVHLSPKVQLMLAVQGAEGLILSDLAMGFSGKGGLYINLH